MTTTARTDVADVLEQAQLPAELTAFIDGAFIPATAESAVLDVDDPATGAVVAHVVETDPAEVAHAVDSAHDAYLAWAGLDPAERGRRLSAVAVAIRAQADLLARLETIDSGKPLSQARADIAGSARYFEYYGGLADKIQGDTIPQPAGTFAYTVREPLRRHRAHHAVERAADPAGPRRRAEPGRGQRGRRQTVRAHAADDALRRAADGRGRPAAPGCATWCSAAATPPARELIQHELVRHITFTGSVATGRSVGDGRGATHRRASTSSSAASRRRSCVPTPTSRPRPARARSRSFATRGSPASPPPGCSSTGASATRFVELLAARMAGLSVGHGLDEPDVGPLISERQFERVMGYLDSARTSGAEIVTGGERADVGGGHFVTPTLLQGVRNDMPVAREEIFGPVQSVLEFDSLEEAVAIANDTEYGLSAGIFTRDVATAHRVAAQLQAGQVQVNRYTGAGVEVPFGGYKNSGLGREKGIDALHHYTQVKSIIMDIA